jgi:hypothetical protein
MIDRRVFVIGFCALVAGCASVPPPPVTSETLQRYRIVGVTVRGAENINSWPAQEAQYVRDANLSEEETKRVAGSSNGSIPALKERMEKSLQTQISGQVKNQLSGFFIGKIPAEHVVTVKYYDIPTLVRRVFTDQYAAIRLDIDLVDKATGRSIALYKGPPSLTYMLGGLASLAQQAVQGDRSDPTPTMLRDYINAYSNWLMSGKQD